MSLLDDVLRQEYGVKEEDPLTRILRTEYGEVTATDVPAPVGERPTYPIRQDWIVPPWTEDRPGTTAEEGPGIPAPAPAPKVSGIFSEPEDRYPIRPAGIARPIPDYGEEIARAGLDAAGRVAAEALERAVPARYPITGLPSPVGMVARGLLPGGAEAGAEGEEPLYVNFQDVLGPDAGRLKTLLVQGLLGPGLAIGEKAASAYFGRPVKIIPLTPESLKEKVVDVPAKVAGHLPLFTIGAGLAAPVAASTAVSPAAATLVHGAATFGVTGLAPQLGEEYTAQNVLKNVVVRSATGVLFSLPHALAMKLGGAAAIAKMDALGLREKMATLGVPKQHLDALKNLSQIEAGAQPIWRTAGAAGTAAVAGGLAYAEAQDLEDALVTAGLFAFLPAIRQAIGAKPKGVPPERWAQWMRDVVRSAQKKDIPNLNRLIAAPGGVAQPEARPVPARVPPAAPERPPPATIAGPPVVAPPAVPKPAEAPAEARSIAGFEGGVFQQKNPLSMTWEETEAEIEVAKTQERDDAIRVLGSPEAVSEFDALMRRSERIGPEGDEAFRKVQGIENSLTEEQKRLLFGHISDPRLVAEDLEEVRKAFEFASLADKPEHLFPDLRRRMPRVDPARVGELESLSGTDIRKNLTEIVSAIRVREALVRLAEMGLSEADIMKGVAADFRRQGVEAADVEFMIREWVAFAKGRKPYPEKASVSEEPSIAGSEPAPEPFNIMGTPVVLDRSQTIEGVRYDLYKATDDSGQGMVRLYDEDSGKVVTLKKHPSFERALAEYDETVRAAEKIAEPEAAAKPAEAPMPETIAGPEAPVHVGVSLAERWDSAKLGVRVEWAMRGRFTTKSGKLTRKGEQIAEAKWADLSPAARRVLEVRIREDYPNLPPEAVAKPAPAPEPVETAEQPPAAALEPKMEGVELEPKEEAPARPIAIDFGISLFRTDGIQELDSAYAQMGKADKEAIEKWLLDTQHPSTRLPGTPKSRFRDVVEELAAAEKAEEKPEPALTKQLAIVEAPPEPPAEADFILRPPMPDADMEGVKKLRGKKGAFTVSLTDSDGKKTTTEASGTLFAEFATHKPEGETKISVTHLKSGMSVLSGLTPSQARLLVYRLQNSGINWDWTDEKKLADADKDKARDIAWEVKEGPMGDVDELSGSDLLLTKGSYQELRDIFPKLTKADPDFKDNPVLTISEVPEEPAYAEGYFAITLEWKSEKPREGGPRSYKLSLSGQVAPGVNLKPGQTIRISRNYLEAVGLTAAQQRKTERKGELKPLEGEDRTSRVFEPGAPYSKSDFNLANISDEMRAQYEIGKEVHKYGQDVLWDRFQRDPNEGDLARAWADGEIPGVPDFASVPFNDPVLGAFVSAGMAGREMPPFVTGWRYGEVPAGGRSTNFREGAAERGVSVMHIDMPGFQPSEAMGTYEAFNEREKVYVSGFLVGKGADGEPILVGVKKISKPAVEPAPRVFEPGAPYSKSDRNLAAAFSRAAREGKSTGALRQEMRERGLTPIQAQKMAAEAGPEMRVFEEGARETGQLDFFADLEAAMRDVSTLGGALVRSRGPAGSDKGPRPTRTVASVVPDALKKGERIDFRGQRVEFAEDLAVLGQVLRDPRVETYWLFATKGAEIVGHMAISSRMPNSSATFLGSGKKMKALQRRLDSGEISLDDYKAQHESLFAQDAERIKDWLRRTGADGYWPLHNHPTGKPKPSEADWAVTHTLARLVPGFKGHVIIDADSYGIISPAGIGLPRTARLPEGTPGAGVVYKTLPESVPEALRKWFAGETSTAAITLPGHVALIGASLNHPEGWAPLLFANANHELVAVEQMPVGLFDRPKDASDYIRGRSREYGAVAVFAYAPQGSEKAARELIENGTLLDARAAGASLSHQGVRAKRGMWMGREESDILAVRVGEEGAEYGDPAERPPDPLSELPPPTGRMPVRLESPRGEVPRGVNAPKIIKALEKVVEVAGLKSPIRTGRIKGKALGVFKVGPEVIRIRTANDVPVAWHETGHALEKALFGYEKGGPWKKPRASGKMQAELVRLGRALYGNKNPEGGYKREGFAEFLRLWGTTEKEALQQAPLVSEFFDDFLKKNADIAEALEAARTTTTAWREMGSVGIARASMVSPGRLRERIQQTGKAVKKAFSKEALMRAHVDMAYPLDAVAREAERLLGAKLRPSEDPYAITTAKRMTHTRVVRYMVEDGMLDIAGNKVGPSLREGMALARGQQEDFTIYLWAKRGLALWNDPKKPKGRNPGISKMHAERVVEELDSPEFQIAASKVYEWNEGLLNYLAQASPAFADLVAKIRAVDPGYYVPLQREFEDLTTRWAGGGASTTGSPVQRLRGSGERVKNPLPTMISNAAKMVHSAHARMVVDAVVNLSKIEGIGRIIERVPKDILVAYRGNLMDVYDRVKSEFAKQGVELDIKNEGDVDAVQGAIAFFAPAQFPKGRDPIVPVVENGKINWYYVKPDLYNSLMALDVYRLPKLFDLAFGMPTRVARAGIVGLRATFGLIRNPARDVQTMWVNTQTSGRGHQLMAAWTRAMYNAMLARTTGAKPSEAYDLFVRLGVEMAQPLGPDTAQAERAIRRLFQGKVVDVLDPRNMFDRYRDLIQFPEAAPRVAEMEVLARQRGIDLTKPISLDDAIVLGTAGKQVTTDFTAAGWFARSVNQIAYFYNANIQGPRVTLRRGRQNPVRIISRGLLALTLPTLLLWWKIKDEEWYKEMDYRLRFAYWNVPTEVRGEKTLFRIPRAFEIGTLFASLPEMIVDAWYRDDPEAVKEWAEFALETSVPSPVPHTAMLVAEELANRKFYWDQPIVSKRLEGKPAEEQYTGYTTRTAITIGETFGLSPQRVDHVIRGLFGGLGADIAALGGRGPKDKTQEGREKELADLPIIGTLFQRGGRLGYRPRSISNLYDKLAEALVQQQSEKKEETKEQRQLRLLLTDAARSVSLLLALRGGAPKKEDRIKLTEEALGIAKDAMKVAAGDAEALRVVFAGGRKDVTVRRNLGKAEEGELDFDTLRLNAAYRLAEAYFARLQKRDADARRFDADVDRFMASVGGKRAFRNQVIAEYEKERHYKVPSGRAGAEARRIIYKERFTDAARRYLNDMRKEARSTRKTEPKAKTPPAPYSREAAG